MFRIDTKSAGLFRAPSPPKQGAPPGGAGGSPAVRRSPTSPLSSSRGAQHHRPHLGGGSPTRLLSTSPQRGGGNKWSGAGGRATSPIDSVDIDAPISLPRYHRHIATATSAAAAASSSSSPPAAHLAPSASAPVVAAWMEHVQPPSEAMAAVKRNTTSPLRFAHLKSAGADDEGFEEITVGSTHSHGPLKRMDTMPPANLGTEKREVKNNKPPGVEQQSADMKKDNLPGHEISYDDLNRKVATVTLAVPTAEVSAGTVNGEDAKVEDNSLKTQEAASVGQSSNFMTKDHRADQQQKISSLDTDRPLRTAIDASPMHSGPMLAATVNSSPSTSSAGRRQLEMSVIDGDTTRRDVVPPPNQNGPSTATLTAASSPQQSSTLSAEQQGRFTVEFDGDYVAMMGKQSTRNSGIAGTFDESTAAKLVVSQKEPLSRFAEELEAPISSITQPTSRPTKQSSQPSPTCAGNLSQRTLVSVEAGQSPILVAPADELNERLAQTIVVDASGNSWMLLGRSPPSSTRPASNASPLTSVPHPSTVAEKLRQMALLSPIPQQQQRRVGHHANPPSETGRDMPHDSSTRREHSPPPRWMAPDSQDSRDDSAVELRRVLPFRDDVAASTAALAFHMERTTRTLLTPGGPSSSLEVKIHVRMRTPPRPEEGPSLSPPLGVAALQHHYDPWTQQQPPTARHLSLPASSPSRLDVDDRHSPRGAKSDRFYEAFLGALSTAAAATAEVSSSSSDLEQYNKELDESIRSLKATLGHRGGGHMLSPSSKGLAESEMHQREVYATSKVSSILDKGVGSSPAFQRSLFRDPAQAERPWL